MGRQLLLIDGRHEDGTHAGIHIAVLALKGAGDLDGLAGGEAGNERVITGAIAQAVVDIMSIFEPEGAFIGLGAAGIFVREADVLAGDGNNMAVLWEDGLGYRAGCGTGRRVGRQPADGGGRYERDENYDGGHYHCEELRIEANVRTRWLFHGISIASLGRRAINGCATAPKRTQ
jgi:hypothetical protein